MNGPALSVPVALVAGASQVVATGPGVYCGIVVRETSGAALVLRIWDNASAASGTIIDIISLAANARTETFTSILPLKFTNGVFIERVSGTNFEGSVRLA